MLDLRRFALVVGVCALLLAPGPSAQLKALETEDLRLIYLDPTRSFGGPLDDRDSRLAHYRATMHEEIIRCADRLPTAKALSD